MRERSPLMLSFSVPERGWRRSPLAEAGFPAGVCATAYFVDSNATGELPSGVSIVVSVVPGDPHPFATAAIDGEIVADLSLQHAARCWLAARICTGEHHALVGTEDRDA